MNAITPFAFEDKLVRTVWRGSEPWFVGKDICTVLDIKNESHALSRLDDDERGGSSVATPSGIQEMIVVSEAGVYRLIFTSRKPEAEVFKRWLAHEVLPTLRREGAYALSGKPVPSPVPPALDEAPAAAITAKLSLVREARLIYGLRRAQALWQYIGLPVPPSADADAADQARELLRLLLLESTEDGLAIAQRIMAAIDGDRTEQATLQRFGIRVADTGPAGFYLANRNPWLDNLFKDTPGDFHRWPYVLRRLTGIVPANRERFDGHASRCTFIPARYLDIDALPAYGGM